MDCILNSYVDSWKYEIKMFCYNDTKPPKISIFEALTV